MTNPLKIDCGCRKKKHTSGIKQTEDRVTRFPAIVLTDQAFSFLVQKEKKETRSRTHVLHAVTLIFSCGVIGLNAYFVVWMGLITACKMAYKQPFNEFKNVEKKKKQLPV